jgi:hypothetical protein
MQKVVSLREDEKTKGTLGGTLTFNCQYWPAQKIIMVNARSKLLTMQRAPGQFAEGSDNNHHLVEICC